MSKEISNPIIVELRYTKIGENWTVAGYIEYGVGIIEYPEFAPKRKLQSLILTPEQEDQIKSFGKIVVAPQLNTDLPTVLI